MAGIASIQFRWVPTGAAHTYEQLAALQKEFDKVHRREVERKLEAMVVTNEPDPEWPDLVQRLDATNRTQIVPWVMATDQPSADKAL